MHDGSNKNMRITKEQARRLNPLQLAYIGDAAYELYVRTCMTVTYGANVHELHKKCCSYVNASAQAKSMNRISDMLTPDESDIARRGRNADVHHRPPKNTSPAEYNAATAFEALMGYLYLAGDIHRFEEIAQLSMADG